MDIYIYDSNKKYIFLLKIVLNLFVYYIHKKENKIDNKKNIHVYHVEITEKQENIKKEMK